MEHVRLLEKLSYKLFVFLLFRPLDRYALKTLIQKHFNIIHVLLFWDVYKKAYLLLLKSLHLLQKFYQYFFNVKYNRRKKFVFFRSGDGIVLCCTGREIQLD